MGDVEQSTDGPGLPRRDVPSGLFGGLVSGQRPCASQRQRRAVVGASNRREHAHERCLAVVSYLSGRNRLHTAEGQPPSTRASTVAGRNAQLLQRSLTPLVADHPSISVQELLRLSSRNGTPPAMRQEGVGAGDTLSAALASTAPGYAPPCDYAFRLPASDAEEHGFAVRLKKAGRKSAIGSPDAAVEVAALDAFASPRTAVSVCRASSSMAPERSPSTTAAAANTPASSAEQSMWRFLRTVSPLAPAMLARGNVEPPAQFPPVMKPKLRLERTNYHMTYEVTQASDHTPAYASQAAVYDATTRCLLGHGSRGATERDAAADRHKIVLSRVAANAARVSGAYALQDAAFHAQRRKVFPDRTRSAGFSMQ